MAASGKRNNQYSIGKNIYEKKLESWEILKQ